MFDWFNKKKKEPAKEPIEEISKETTKEETPQSPTPPEVPVAVRQNEDHINILIEDDEMGMADDQLIELIKKTSSIPIYDKEVLNGYSLSFAKTTSTCPECHGSLQQHYAQFIYTDGMGARNNVSPSGYFCGDCPTVVIDEHQLSQSVSRGIQYKAVFGVESQSKGLSLFKTWNGRKPTAVMDEHQNIVDFGTLEDLKKKGHDLEDYHRQYPQLQSSSKSKSGQKRKKKAARKARKRNRRKK